MNIKFVENLIDEKTGKVLNASYDADSRTVTVNINGADPIVTSVVHESIHDLAVNNPEVFGLVATKVKDAFSGNKAVMKRAFGDIADRYSDYLKNPNYTIDGRIKAGELRGVDRALADEEFVSSFMSYVMSNPKSLRVIAEQDRNIFQKVYDAVVSMFDFVLGRYDRLDLSANPNLQEALNAMKASREELTGMYREIVNNYVIPEGNGSVAFEMFSTTEPFNKQIDKVLKPNSKYNKYVYVGNTSNILQKCGYPPLPVLMTPGHIRAINTPKSENKPGESRYHGLTPDQIKHIPEMLKNPIMVYDSISEDYENTVCVLTNEFDGDNNPIIVVFKYVEGIPKSHIPEHCVIEAGNYNMVASEYGRTNFENHLQLLISGGKVLYVNKSRFEKFLNNKTLNLSTDNKVQFLESFNKSGFDKIIHPSENFVNKNNDTNFDNGVRRSVVGRNS